MTTTTKPAAGWYLDPRNDNQVRWWDGTRWAELTAPVPAGAEAVDDSDCYADEVPPSGPASAGPALEGPVAGRSNQAATGSRRRGMVVVIMILVILLAAGAWFWTKRVPTGDVSVAVAGSPGSGPVAQVCTDTVAALTADGTAATVGARLQSAATGADLPGATEFFSTIGEQAAPVMTTTGAACLQAVTSGQAPEAYATFINSLNKALDDAVVVVSAGLGQNAVLTPEQAATLTQDAQSLAQAQAAVTSDAPAVPTVAPVG